jgi:hypothetical protein
MPAPLSRDAYAIVVLIVGMAVLQFSLRGAHELTPHGAIATVILLGLPLAWVVARRRRAIGPVLRRTMAVYLILLVALSVANAILLLIAVMRDSSAAPIALLIGGFEVMAINMLSFGLIYWWLDAADPGITAGGGQESPDFLFPQQAIPGSSWQPGLADYIYVAFTNLLAFSPTDTMPLRIRTKMLFMVQSSTATFCAVIILGHAINSLPDSA